MFWSVVTHFKYRDKNEAVDYVCTNIFIVRIYTVGIKIDAF
jgi:hypothetical protein